MTTLLGPSELRSILAFTVNLARTAGTIILEGSQAIQSASGINEKKNSVDLVTEYDVAVENLVIGEIKKAYPSFKFIGEESVSKTGTLPELTDDPTFCVDPIDGTTNFVHGFPFCCISLGLIYQKRAVLGVVYNPFLGYLYTGVEGQGSYLTRNSGPPMKLPLASPKPLPSLSKALVAVEWGSDRGTTTLTSKADSFLRLAADGAIVNRGKMVHSLRTTGSGALNFVMIAQGGLDIAWEIGCWPWDVCAAIVIAQEAGCAVTASHSFLASTTSAADAFTLTPEALMGRKFLIVRAVPETPVEPGREAQLRLAKEFYATADDTLLK
ncbi:myo inositol monophosphatase [Phlebopus sp. FC_14]|nr:myo inositol monophosphatase [Phlebopus sp. FC_14]